VDKRGDQSKMKRSTMKMKLKGFSVGLALATMLTTVANATLTVYNWVPDASTSDNGANSSGTLDIDAGVISSFSFTLGETTFDSFTGTTEPGHTPTLILTDRNLQLDGQSASTTSESLATWTPQSSPGLDENQVSVLGDPDYGDWVAVPEPSTIIAGALLLLPFGARTLRLLRKNRSV
jgi:hypothetical protein